ncbi:MAG: winged helix-turn-helix transcriptional regulator [Lachnospiraceae bacterium]|nr:winged helix-turn-helix transcriptional regulator [Lachnospiraceae bacterium]
MMKETPDISISEMANSLKMTVDGVRYHIKKLTALGRVERVGGTRGGSWKVH